MWEPCGQAGPGVMHWSLPKAPSPAIMNCLDLRVLSPSTWPACHQSLSVTGVLGAEGWSGWWGALEILILTRSDSQYGFGPVPLWAPVSSSVEETAWLGSGTVDTVDQILLLLPGCPVL